MIKNIALLFIFIIATTSWTYFSNTNSKVGLSYNGKHNLVSDFSFQDMNNQTHTLYDYKGKTVLLHFWATWCAPCIKELPELINLATENQNNMYIIAMAVSDKKADISHFLSKNTPLQSDNFIVGLDPDKVISQNIYDTVQLPETYVITSNLRLLEKVIGAQNDWKNYKPVP